jgi:hypothetical protein
MHAIVWTRNFLTEQGIDIKDNVVHQDNQSAMLLENNGRASSGRRTTRHVNIRYFFVADRIETKELRVEYCPTDDMWGDFMTKAQQGSKFRRMRAKLMNISEAIALPTTTTTASQECVGKPSYAEAVRGTRGTVVMQTKKVQLPVTGIRLRTYVNKC